MMKPAERLDKHVLWHVKDVHASLIVTIISASFGYLQLQLTLPCLGQEQEQAMWHVEKAMLAEHVNYTLMNCIIKHKVTQTLNSVEVTPDVQSCRHKSSDRKGIYCAIILAISQTCNCWHISLTKAYFCDCELTIMAQSERSAKTSHFKLLYIPSSNDMVFLQKQTLRLKAVLRSAVFTVTKQLCSRKVWKAHN